jgi:hypothetical protein
MRVRLLGRRAQRADGIFLASRVRGAHAVVDVHVDEIERAVDGESLVVGICRRRRTQRPDKQSDQHNDAQRARDVSPHFQLPSP